MNSTLCNEHWWSEGLYFSCLGCGRCCRGEPGCVWITEDEIKKIAEFFSLKEREFLSKYTCRIDDRVTLREKRNGECVFYDSESNRCTIYKVRPLQCRLFPFWPSLMACKENWEREKLRCPGIGEGEYHSAQKIEKLLAHAPYEDL